MLGWESVNGHGRWRIINNVTDQFFVTALRPLPKKPPTKEDKCRFTYYKVVESDNIEVRATRCEKCNWESSVRCENGVTGAMAQSYIDLAAFKHHLANCKVPLIKEPSDTVSKLPLQINGVFIGNITQTQAIQLTNNWVEKSVVCIPDKLINITTTTKD